ncbi:putative hydroxypyruvate isomerase [Belonocnema kinseyi]|uniref:putative hydroxypyruvate isomerase n=1 Tax=Belonocnema kinseyi TaxID=2817044 RepID=UPI00143D1ACA|nr:putative hydroxypyruvate isomerase [Belonocnema kinseyi]XP_033216453.1 putative hydroxypyruvate isomerase [Belonocnema kinseyi]
MSFEEFKNEIEVGSRDCRKKGTTIRSKEREVIKSIIEFCDQEARQKCLFFPLRQATKRAAQYAKVSERTVKRIREQVKLGIEFTDNETHSSPLKVIPQHSSRHIAQSFDFQIRRKMSLKVCSSLSFMFLESPTIIGRYQLAKDAGFKAVESGFPLGFSIEQVVEAKTKAGVDQVLINLFTGDVDKGEVGFAAIPGKEENFEKSVDLTIEYAKALSCKKIHIMAGSVEVLTKANDEVFERNIRHAVSKFEANDIMGLIEPINPYDLPNYYMDSAEKALAIVKKINSPYLRIMLDVFHLQQICGNLTRVIRECLPYTGHVQVAQVPDRHEPDTAGELDYVYLFSLLEKEGYNGYVGLEYTPKASTVEGLKWIERYGFSF